MRNLFDQYDQPENRLTHALACSLGEDPRLLRSFLRQIAGCRPPRERRLSVMEQSLPGEIEASEEEAERRGLPDAWIHDGESWCLLLESKVAARPTKRQLEVHLRTASGRGFDDARLLLLAPVEPRLQLPEGCRFVPWSDVYRWARGHRAVSEWARRFANYMEAAERRMTESGYLKEGALTEFSGIPFSEDEPYNYPEAKRTLRLAMGALRERRDLEREALADLSVPGRPAITGSTAAVVWDFIPLCGAERDRPFTRYPHLTLAVESDRAYTHLTVPNGVQQRLRGNLVRLGADGLREVLEDVAANLRPALREDPHAAPWLIMLQRRYPSQRAQPIIDAKLEFDLRTAPEIWGKRSRVKRQSQWLDASIESFLKRSSNLQLAVGAIFPYRSSTTVHSEKLLDIVAATWVACRPLADAVLGRKAG